MMVNNKKIHLKILYNFFIFLSSIIFFFSTTKVFAKAFNVNDIDISRPFEINFDKNEVIDDGFNKAFFQLISSILNSSDQKKINKIKLNEIKGMIESFSIKEEKFINEIYHLSLGVSFNKKKTIGQTIKKKDLEFTKNSKNLSPVFSHKIVGKKIIKDIHKNKSLNLNKIKNKIGAIIVTRMTSNRFPNKEMKKINEDYYI